MNARARRGLIKKRRCFIRVGDVYGVRGTLRGGDAGCEDTFAVDIRLAEVQTVRLSQAAAGADSERSGEREPPMRDASRLMGQALAETGRTIVYSLCHPASTPFGKGTGGGAALCHTIEGIDARFDRRSLIKFELAGLSKFAGPGQFNDPITLRSGTEVDSGRTAST